MSQTGWIAVDLDGTLAHYDGWVAPTHIGVPIPAMVERVNRWLAAGWEVRIFTARVTNPEERPGVEAAIRAWLAQNGLPLLQVTNIKDFQMVELWDDRAVQVVLNTGEPVGHSTRGL